MIKHKSLDTFLLEDKIFNIRYKAKNISLKEYLYTDPYYRFKRLLIVFQKIHHKINSNINWLDLGCHGGQFVSILKNFLKIGSVTGIDQWNVKEQITWLDFNYIETDLFENWTEKLSGKFDVISALEVIEHMIDTDAFLLKCKKQLKNNGFLILTTPNLNSLRNRLTFPFGLYPTSMEYKNLIHHVRIYNVPKIKSHLKEHEFKIIKIIGVNFLPAKLLKYKFLRLMSELLADLFPALCPNIIIFAKNK